MKKKIAALREQINMEIEKENYEEADMLSKELCELQGFAGLDGVMPETFALDIIAKERKDRGMRLRRFMTKAAAAVIILGLSGGTVFAATRYYQRAYHETYGLSNKKNTVQESDTITEYTNPNGGDDTVETELSGEQGNSKTLWTNKREMSETHTAYSSDDGQTWEPYTVSSKWTEYTYPDYATACKDMGVSGILGKAYKQKGEVIRKEYELTEMGEISTSVEAIFQYGNGSFKLEEDDTRDADGKPIRDQDVEHLLISSTEPVTNQREYTFQNGIVFALCDDTEMGEKCTTTMITDGAYSAVFTFTGLSEEEIYSILETVRTPQ